MFSNPRGGLSSCRSPVPRLTRPPRSRWWPADGSPAPWACICPCHSLSVLQSHPMLRVPQARRDLVCSVPSWVRLELFPLRVLPGYVWWSHHRGHRLDPQTRTSRAGLPRPSSPEGFSAGCSRKPRSCHLVGSRGPGGGAESLLSSLQVSAGRWHRPSWSSVSDKTQVQAPSLTWRKWRLFSEQFLHCIHHVHGLYLFGWFLFTSEFGTHGMTENFVYL